MELSTYVPALFGYLDDFNQVGGWVDAHALHALGLVLVSVGIVELVTVTVSLLDGELSVEG